MIIAVNQENEMEWAKLCVSLWPEISKEEMLQGRAEGEFTHEYLYVKDDHIIAFISLSLRNDYVEGTDSSPVGYIEGIYVNEEYRGQGIGRALIEYAKKWSIEQGCSQLASDVELDNHMSELFHQKIGFKEANRLICYTMDLK